MLSRVKFIGNSPIGVFEGNQDGYSVDHTLSDCFLIKECVNVLDSFRSYRSKLSFYMSCCFLYIIHKKYMQMIVIDEMSRLLQIWI